MTDIIETGLRHTKRAVLDGKRLYVHTLVHDDPIIELNKKIALERALERTKMPFHDNADVRAHIQVDPELWARFKREHPDVYKLMNSTSEDDRMRGVRKLHILHPEWVTYARY